MVDLLVAVFLKSQEGTFFSFLNLLSFHFFFVVCASSTTLDSGLTAQPFSTAESESSRVNLMVSSPFLCPINFLQKLKKTLKKTTTTLVVD